MDITYTWEVTAIKKDAIESVVQVYWNKTGTIPNGRTGSFAGATPFNNADPNAEDYIPFSNLTEADVLGWVQEVVVDSYEEHVNAQIKKQIENQVIVDAEMPWVSK